MSSTLQFKQPHEEEEGEGKHPRHLHHLHRHHQHITGLRTAVIMLFLSSLKSTAVSSTTPIARRPKTTPSFVASFVLSSHWRRRPFSSISSSTSELLPRTHNFYNHHDGESSSMSSSSSLSISASRTGSPASLPNYHHGRFIIQQQQQSLRAFSSSHLLTTERVTAVLEGSPTSLASYTSSSSETITATTAPAEPPENSFASLENLSKLKVQDLRIELSIRGLDKKGKRDVLRARLQDALEKEQESLSSSSSTSEEASSSLSNGDETTTTDTSVPAVGEPTQEKEEDMSSRLQPPRMENPESLDLDKMYILRVRAHTTPSSGGAGIGMVLYSCYDDEGDDSHHLKMTSSGTTIPFIKDELWSGRVYLSGNRSMFEADYTALLVGLDFATTQFKIRRLHLQVDNDVLVRQIEGAYGVNRPTLQALLHCWHDQRQALLSYCPKMEYLDVSHISFQENATAMAIAQTAMVTRKSVNLLEGDYQVTDPLVTAQQRIAKETKMAARLNKSSYDNTVHLPLPQEQEDILDSIQSSEQEQQLGLLEEEESSSRTLTENAAVENDAAMIDPLKTDVLQRHGEDEDKQQQPRPSLFPSLEELNPLKAPLPHAATKNPAHDSNTSSVSSSSSSSTPEETEKNAGPIIDPSKTYLLQFDGGSRGNPGVAGAGMVIFDYETGEEVWCGWKYHSDHATNNLAEYLGLLCGLKCAKSLGIRHLIVEGDSQLIVRHLKGQYKCREATLKVFFQAAKKIIAQDLDTFDIQHIRRAENSRADFLANHAMDTRESGGFTIQEMEDLDTSAAAQDL